MGPEVAAAAPEMAAKSGPNDANLAPGRRAAPKKHGPKLKKRARAMRKARRVAKKLKKLVGVKEPQGINFGKDKRTLSKKDLGKRVFVPSDPNLPLFDQWLDNTVAPLIDVVSMLPEELAAGQVEFYDGQYEFFDEQCEDYEYHNGLAPTSIQSEANFGIREKLSRSRFKMTIGIKTVLRKTPKWPQKFRAAIKDGNGWRSFFPDRYLPKPRDWSEFFSDDGRSNYDLEWPYDFNPVIYYHVENFLKASKNRATESGSIDLVESKVEGLEKAEGTQPQTGIQGKHEVTQGSPCNSEQTAIPIIQGANLGIDEGASTKTFADVESNEDPGCCASGIIFSNEWASSDGAVSLKSGKLSAHEFLPKEFRLRSRGSLLEGNDSSVILSPLNSGMSLISPFLDENLDSKSLGTERSFSPMKTLDGKTPEEPLIPKAADSLPKSKGYEEPGAIKGPSKTLTLFSKIFFPNAANVCDEARENDGQVASSWVKSQTSNTDIKFTAEGHLNSEKYEFVAKENRKADNCCSNVIAGVLSSRNPVIGSLFFENVDKSEVIEEIYTKPIHVVRNSGTPIANGMAHRYVEKIKAGKQDKFTHDGVNDSERDFKEGGFSGDGILKEDTNFPESLCSTEMVKETANFKGSKRLVTVGASQSERLLEFELQSIDSYHRQKRSVSNVEEIKSLKHLSSEDLAKKFNGSAYNPVTKSEAYSQTKEASDLSADVSALLSDHACSEKLDNTKPGWKVPESSSALLPRIPEIKNCDSCGNQKATTKSVEVTSEPNFGTLRSLALPKKSHWNDIPSDSENLLITSESGTLRPIRKEKAPKKPKAIIKVVLSTPELPMQTSSSSKPIEEVGAKPEKKPHLDSLLRIQGKSLWLTLFPDGILKPGDKDISEGSELFSICDARRNIPLMSDIVALGPQDHFFGTSVKDFTDLSSETLKQPLAEEDRKKRESKLWKKIDNCRATVNSLRGEYDLKQIKNLIFQFSDCFKFTWDNFSSVATMQMLDYFDWLLKNKKSIDFAFNLVCTASEMTSSFIRIIKDTNNSEENLEIVLEGLNHVLVSLSEAFMILDQVQDGILQMRQDFPNYVPAMVNAAQVALISSLDISDAYNDLCSVKVKETVDKLALNEQSGYSQFVKNMDWLTARKNIDYESIFGAALNDLQKAFHVVDDGRQSVEELIKDILLKVGDYRACCEA
ncbi:hypothetical protein METBIDRAFT_229614 [Metschnikowia bicuspidata var. bicuspidata NRRL YB-4993]|uniref:Uncharacterized protein n=1 Tax=Metschnikowia bicuspidata var. bicuspidata NRRL YB-4993 TaxID=869754 RepID=A0A1A0HB62_9ASCO|nr:hypothetical protein METBIDRAFT_229614 [Metschnikowia bicuspidata var. bicuspidata NRRL YB-4993]OBA21117.1 hypothetical protein METBIDRAFT_229614 [Metschnikowia bicuspidata var. bicuspidata NRRL YB-4993]